LNSHEITLPTTPGIAVAALPARDLRSEAIFLRPPFNRSMKLRPGKGEVEGFGVGTPGLADDTRLDMANAMVEIIIPIAVVIDNIVIPSFLNNSLSLSPSGFSLVKIVQILSA